MNRASFVLAGLFAVVLGACGSSDSGGDTPPGTNQPVPDPTLASIQSVVMGPTCALSECHKSTADKEMNGAQFDTLADAKASLLGADGTGAFSLHYSTVKLVDPGHPETSLLMAVLDAKPGTSVDENLQVQSDPDAAQVGSMPDDSTVQLSQAQRDAIRTWITNGAKD